MNDKVKNTLKKVLDAKKQKEKAVLKERLLSMPKPSIYKTLADSFL